MEKCKRLLTLLMTACLLLSMAIPAVWAEESVAPGTTVEYSFKYMDSVQYPKPESGNTAVYHYPENYQALTDAYNAGTVNSMYVHWSSTKNPALNTKGYSQTGYVGDWVAFKLRAPGAGKFLLEAIPIRDGNSPRGCEVYVLPAETAADAIGAALTDETRVGEEVDFKTNDAQQMGNFTHTGAEELLVVFKQTKNKDSTTDAGVRADFKLAGVRLTKIGEAEDTVKPVDTDYSFKYMDSVQYPKPESGNTAVYHYPENYQALTDAYNAGTVNSMYVHWSSTKNPALNTKGYSQTGYVGDWVAFEFRSPGAGNFTLEVIPVKDSNAPKGCEVYILPADTAADAIGAALTEDTLVGEEVNLNRTSEPQRVGTVKLGSDEKYLAVFKQTKNLNGATDTTTRADFKLAGMRLLVADEAGGADDGIKPVKSEVAISNAILTATFSRAAISNVNGHDYLYLFMSGGKMLVYDLDTKQKVDEKTDAINTTRSIAIDSNGILWACGKATYLYRYDPYTRTSSQVSFDRTGLFGGAEGVSDGLDLVGLTVDEDDNLFFGVIKRGQLGMYDQKTGEVSNVSGGLIVVDEPIGPAVTGEQPYFYCGFGGVIRKGDYLYAAIDGDANGDGTSSHQIIKFSLTEKKVVQNLDISECWGIGGSYFQNLNLVGDKYLLGGSDSMLSKTIAIDISGEEMKLVEIPGMDVGFTGFVSGEINGKVYCLGNTKMDGGMYEIDLETMVATELSKDKFPADAAKLVCWGSQKSLVTIEGDDRLPGVSLMTMRNNSLNGVMEPVFYNIETQQTVAWDDLTKGEGSGNQLRCLITSDDGKQLYLSAYGTSQLAVYDVETGKIVQQFPTYSTQIEGLQIYDGVLYAGNYGACGIAKIDLENSTYTRLNQLQNGAFEQERIHATASGDGMVFFGTAAAKDSASYGGVLSWYDLDEERVYVAAGPNKEDVYYTPAGNISNTGWYSALTGELMDWDADKDGTDDYMVTVDGVQVPRFTGLIEHQSVICIAYQDGYIYGCTSNVGGSNTVMEGVGNACLFVYDVKNMQIVGTYDVIESIPDLATPVSFIDVIAADPAVDGKFWGVVSNTLFSFTFDREAKTFAVTVEKQMSKGGSYSNGGNLHQGRDIIFDGNYMYVIFGDFGVYMFDRTNPEQYYQLSYSVPKRMVKAADGNLYYIDNNIDLKVLRVADVTQPMAAQSVQAMIDALPETVTAADEAAVSAIRDAYDALTEAAKTSVNTAKLEAAEAILAELKAAQKAAADKAAADAVTAKIEAIGEVTLEDEAAIAEARAAYDALTDDQKALVDATALTAAEKTYEQLLKDATNPGTGDHSPVMLFVLMAVLSVTVLAVLVVPGYKRRNASR